MLSLLLWCLVMNELLGRLIERGFVVQGYTDNVALLFRKPFLEPLLELMQNARGIVAIVHMDRMLVNPLKTGFIVFIYKYKVGTIERPIFLRGETSSV